MTIPNHPRKLLIPERLNRGDTQIETPEGVGFKGAPCLKAWHYLVVQADGKPVPVVYWPVRVAAQQTVHWLKFGSTILSLQMLERGC